MSSRTAQLGPLSLATTWPPLRMHAPSSYYWANKTSRSVEEYVEVEQLKKTKTQ